jgi:diaminopimelate epimerase
MIDNTYVITAAGGNGTAIRILGSVLSRAGYEEQGRRLMAETQRLGVEQVGFLVPADGHFEMGGGEFCGNATRCAAALFSLLQRRARLSFTVSGFSGTVEAEVAQLDDRRFDVRCVFPGLQVERRTVVAAGRAATLVDLGGIVHVVVEGAFPAAYAALHRRVTEELSLGDRDAVGVLWIRQGRQAVTMEPVVWVRSVDTFVHEASCGSGAIAVAETTGMETIIQPTGRPILVSIAGDGVVVRSEVEVTHHY